MLVDTAMLSILVLEPNLVFLSWFTRTLRQGGYQVAPVSTLPLACALMDDVRFELWICALDEGNQALLAFLHDQAAALREEGTRIMVVSDTPDTPAFQELQVDRLLPKLMGQQALLRLVQGLLAR